MWCSNKGYYTAVSELYRESSTTSRGCRTRRVSRLNCGLPTLINFGRFMYTAKESPNYTTRHGLSSLPCRWSCKCHDYSSYQATDKWLFELHFLLLNHNTVRNVLKFITFLCYKGNVKFDNICDVCEWRIKIAKNVLNFHKMYLKTTNL